MDTTMSMSAAAGTAMDVTAIMLLTTILIPLVGIMMAITPYLMKKSECFAVTVPESALHDPYLQGLKRRYLVTMVLITAVLTLLGAVFSLTGKEFAVIVLIAVGALLIIVVGYGLMLHFRSKVRAYKKEQGWEAATQESVALIDGEEIPRAISLKWNLLYLPVMLLTLAIGYTGYVDMPDLVPMHVGLDGQVDNYVVKTPLIVWNPVLIQAFLAIAFLFSHWVITRSKRLSNPHAPATSALAYGMFARAQSLYLIAVGLIICILMVAMPLSFMGIITFMQSAVFIMIGALVAVIGAIAISVVYGQGGARVFARMQASDKLLADDDRYWKLGVFYYNPQDSSLFLLERFGVGWTVNFARPAIWAIMVGFTVLTVAFIVVISAIS